MTTTGFPVDRRRAASLASAKAGLAARLQRARARFDAPRGASAMRGAAERARLAASTKTVQGAAHASSMASGAWTRRARLLQDALQAKRHALIRKRHADDVDGDSASPQRGSLSRAMLVALGVAVLWWVWPASCGDPPTKVTDKTTPALAACAACPEAPLCVPPVRVARPRPVPRAKARMTPTAREDLDVGERAPPPWLEAFRRQVMARSTVLAACFAGSERPGAAWWTARLEPRAGVASEGRLEPAQGGAPLSSAQEQCVLHGLQATAYALGSAVDVDPDPRRLRLLLEF
jgi:hypothetical protein